MSLLVSRARMEGFVVFDFAKRYPEGIKAMAGWMAEGKLMSKSQIEEGIENFPSVLLKLFTGGNFGKLILKNTDINSLLHPLSSPTMIPLFFLTMQG